MLMLLGYINLNFWMVHESINSRCAKLAFYLNFLFLSKLCNAAVIKKVSESIAFPATFIFISCDGRVVKALDLKSNGVSPRRFESCSQREFHFLTRKFIILTIYVGSNTKRASNGCQMLFFSPKVSALIVRRNSTTCTLCQ